MILLLPSDYQKTIQNLLPHLYTHIWILNLSGRPGPTHRVTEPACNTVTCRQSALGCICLGSTGDREVVVTLPNITLQAISMEPLEDYQSPFDFEQGVNTNYLYLSPAFSDTPPSSPAVKRRGNHWKESTVIGWRMRWYVSECVCLDWTEENKCVLGPLDGRNLYVSHRSSSLSFCFQTYFFKWNYYFMFMIRIKLFSSTTCLIGQMLWSVSLVIQYCNTMADNLVHKVYKNSKNCRLFCVM